LGDGFGDSATVTEKDYAYEGREKFMWIGQQFLGDGKSLSG